MSEYQYYDFQALDRPLSAGAQAEMRTLSSRVQLTASSASFVYNYGDFRGDPYDVLARHFDAMLYITNWGTRQLMFRFPAEAISAEVQRNYQYAESLEWSEAAEYIIVNIALYPEEGGGGFWVEGEGLLSGIAQVRNDILRGDYRALYLAWLCIAGYELDMLEDDEDLTEPPVPPNLQALSPALRNFIDFFNINPDLVNAAAQASAKLSQPKENLSAHLNRLSEDEKRDFLVRLLNGETHLDIALANRLRELSGTRKSGEATAGERRTLRQLVEISEGVSRQRRAEERRKAEAARLQHLEKVAKQEDQLWARIPDLIAQKKANTYEEAVNILKDLRALAEYQERLSQFSDKMAAIRDQYPTLSGLQRRLKAAQLI